MISRLFFACRRSVGFPSPAVIVRWYPHTLNESSSFRRYTTPAWSPIAMVPWRNRFCSNLTVAPCSEETCVFPGSLSGFGAMPKPGRLLDPKYLTQAPVSNAVPAATAAAGAPGGVPGSSAQIPSPRRSILPGTAPDPGAGAETAGHPWRWP